MHAKHALDAPEAHALVQRIEDPRSGRLAMRHRFGVRVKAATTGTAYIRLSAIFRLSILDHLIALT